MAGERCHHRTILRAQLHREGVRIGLDVEAPRPVADFVLVGSAGADAGNRQLPNAPRRASAHHMNVPMPLVERTHHADPFGVGRLYGESSACRGTVAVRVRTELVIDALVRAFAEQINIEVGKP